MYIYDAINLSVKGGGGNMGKGGETNLARHVYRFLVLCCKWELYLRGNKRKGGKTN